VEEWLYHLGVPEHEIHELAMNHTSCIPCIMPYITAFFMPRAAGDRPKVVPDGCTNLAFIGQFAETPRDTVFTTEYSVRTAMEAVYTLMDVDRGVPEVFGSCYDVRVLLDATSRLLDGEKVTDMKLPLQANMAKKLFLKKISGTVIEDLLKKL
jgi:oleate hydratase